MNSISEIQINNLIWTPDRHKPSVLKGISLTLRQGEIYGILGSNGAGKTSLVRHILGLLSHEKGSVMYDGVPIENFSRNETAAQISFLPQSFSTDVDFTVYDVVAMGREPYRKPFSTLTSYDRQMIEDAFDLANCKDLEEKRLSTLSGGELQRVMIARTIAQDTPWIILDEPISSLDIRQQAEIMNAMSRMHREQGRTVIAILHDLNLAADFCTQLVLMKKGEVIASGSTEDVLTPENLSCTFDVPFQFMAVDERQQPYVFPKAVGKQMNSDVPQGTAGRSNRK